MTMDDVLSLIRHILTFGAGYLVANKMLDDATSQQLIAAAMVLIPVIWSAIARRRKEAQS